MKIFLFITIALFFMPHLPAIAGEASQLPPEVLDDVKNNTLRPFFNALENGNVRQIERYISGQKAQEARLSQNEDSEYRELLKEYYRGVVFSVERAVSSGDQIIVDVKIEFPGRGWKLTQFYLQQQDVDVQGGAASSGRRWSIVEQRHDRDKGR